MTKDEIIEMAIQAHYESKTWIDIYKDEITAGTVRGYLEAFAKLVAAKERDRMCKQCNWSKHENATCNEANQSKILGKS